MLGAALVSLLPFLAGAAAASIPLGSIKLINSCPDAISVNFLGYGNPQAGPLNIHNASSEMIYFPDFNGVVYATSSGIWGTGGATKAIIDVKGLKYGVAKDSFNYPVRLTPPAPLSGTPTAPIFCETKDCADASAIFPPDASKLRSSPANGDWHLEFCAKKEAEPEVPLKGVPIHFKGDAKLCLDVAGNIRQNGTPVQVYECNDTPAQRWEIKRGQTQVRLADTNFCLDAGSNPAAGVGMKIWTCYDNIPAQTMWYTDDNRIAVKDKGLCLTSAGTSITTQWCTNGNNNQVWKV